MEEWEEEEDWDLFPEGMELWDPHFYILRKGSQIDRAKTRKIGTKYFWMARSI